MVYPQSSYLEAAESSYFLSEPSVYLDGPGLIQDERNIPVIYHTLRQVYDKNLTYSFKPILDSNYCKFVIPESAG